jgi:hypothetical protein
MCAYGKRIVDEWGEYANLIEVLELRRHIGPLYKSEVKTDLTYEEVKEKVLAAQTAFLVHESVCADCYKSFGKTWGCDSKG